MINQTLATYKTIAGRQRKGREEWTRNFEASLLAKTGTLPQPRHDELQFYAISDEHCNLASIDALAKLADSEKPDGIFTLGDNTDGGTTYEQFCIDKLAALKGSGETERPFGGVTGNHDSDEIINARRKLGIPTLTGETVKFGELTITGDRDPEQNRPFTSVLYPVNGKDQETAGRELAEKTHGKNVDAALVHEPRMGQAYTAHMDPRTRLVLWGHTHKSTPPTVIRHRDGTWTVQKQLGSAGGTHIPGASSSLSLPWDKPTGPVVFSVIYMNKDTKLVTGMRDVQISTEGTLAYEKRQSFVAPKNTMVKPHI
jgi:predicted phosphodiesterase